MYIHAIEEKICLHLAFLKIPAQFEDLFEAKLWNKTNKSKCLQKKEKLLYHQEDYIHNIISSRKYYCECNFPMTLSVRLSIGRSVGLSAIIF